MKIQSESHSFESSRSKESWRFVCVSANSCKRRKLNAYVHWSFAWQPHELLLISCCTTMNEYSLYCNIRATCMMVELIACYPTPVPAGIIEHCRSSSILNTRRCQSWWNIWDCSWLASKLKASASERECILIANLVSFNYLSWKTFSLLLDLLAYHGRVLADRIMFEWHWMWLAN